MPAKKKPLHLTSPSHIYNKRRGERVLDVMACFRQLLMLRHFTARGVSMNVVNHLDLRLCF